MHGLVKTTNDTFADAIARGDAAAAASVYAEDATLLPPGTKALVGRAAVERFWRDELELGTCGLELETLELERYGNAAFEVGRYVLASAATDAAATIDRGKYVVIHKRQGDGSWKRGVDIFNSDAPADRSQTRPVDAVGLPRSGRDTWPT